MYDNDKSGDNLHSSCLPDIASFVNIMVNVVALLIDWVLYHLGWQWANISLKGQSDLECSTNWKTFVLFSQCSPHYWIDRHFSDEKLKHCIVHLFAFLADHNLKTWYVRWMSKVSLSNLNMEKYTTLFCL